MAKELALPSSPSDDQILRRRLPVEKFEASMWADTFTAFSFDIQAQEKRSKAIESLKEKVREMIIAGGSELNEKLILIDTVERLGLAYHFKHEIEEQLESIASNLSEHNDLYTSALRFRILRQHHYRVSSSVFNKFKGKDGKFEEMLSRDAKGLLSLLEASQVRIHGEDILEEGLVFATYHLNVLAPTLEVSFKDQVNRALEHPPHHGLSRIEARKYISFYASDSSHNKVLLEFAILDFNYLQNLYLKELHDLSWWWNKIDLKSKLTYLRDRVPEIYFWSLGVFFEPQESLSRLAVAKCTFIATVLDDTYDNYATVEEAETFNKVLQRWDINEIDQLPDYMKVAYKFIMNTYEELACEASKQGRSSVIPYIREAIKEISRGYNQELKWFMGMDMPTVETYNSNSLITSTVFLNCMAALVGIKSASEEVFEWVENRPKLVVASSRIGRILDDKGSHEREDRGGELLTAVTMYMKQHGTTKQETLNKFGEMVEDLWKEFYAEWCNLPSLVSFDAANVFIDFARMAETLYMHSQDGVTTPEKYLAPDISSILLDPIII
ncbi:probable 5-epi-aristolochene synthase 4 [Andrographis paniculata]|uniref:probable 5-epi-aristolochene synthase 4 n=1 Tax=Andrographis paniculata TaxID=175694 RepID=UPI0021E73933|nr:probable 5-epi-aristolochene synthase 4 [Andrographis paniculata]QJA18331.1 terpene synthase 16 [Andrographis paniculata]